MLRDAAEGRGSAKFLQSSELTVHLQANYEVKKTFAKLRASAKA